jgi:uncharacterized protein
MKETATMYHQIIMQCVQGLRQLQTCIDKAEQYASAKDFDVTILLNSRLAPDMGNFIYQVASACDYVKAAAGRLAGEVPPVHEDTEQTIDDVRARLSKTIAYSEGVPREPFDVASDRFLSVPWMPGKVIKGEDYLLQIILPNVYFHLVTAYDILRHNGVDVGKMDFLGHINFLDAKVTGS